MGAGSVTDYLYGGFTVSLGIRAILDRLGERRSIANVLDFGCGAGRLARWLNRDTDVFGVDINRDAVAWCTSNLAGEFSVGRASPPLHYPNEKFDLLVAVSVLSHLDEQLQFEWLNEFNRITRPGAILLLSVHGPDKARRDLDGNDRHRFGDIGHVFRQALARNAAGTPDGSVEGLPGFYQVAYHSHEYIARTWSNFFDVLGIVEHGPLYYQDLVVLRKRAGSGSRDITARPWTLRLPIAVLETPGAGIKINNDHVDVRGWAFRPDGQDVQLAIWIDDQLVGECHATLPRPDVAEGFFTDPSAGQSGFATGFSIGNLPGGPHMLWLSLAGDSFPLCGTFFIRDPMPVRRIKHVVRNILGMRRA